MEVMPYNHGGNCLYSDVSTSKITFDKNVCYGPWKHGSALYHHCGIDNLSTNNIAHRKAPTQKLQPGEVYNGIWSACETTRAAAKGGTGEIQQYVNEKNIYFIEDYSGLEFMRPWDQYHGATYRNNVYWSLTAGMNKEKMFRAQDTRKFINWDEWHKQQNIDTGSLWDDPLFQDASKMDYTLKANSPAKIKLGIEDVPLNWTKDLDVQTDNHMKRVKSNAENLKNFVKK